jgi:small subunit ribosomal protein S11e
MAYVAGTYIDKKCPFTGTVSIRGRIIAGTCHSAKMNRTIIVRRNYLHFVKKYQRQANLHWLNFFGGCCIITNILAFMNRYEKRHSNIPAHISPCFRVREGDHVIIGQCRLKYFTFLMHLHVKAHYLGSWMVEKLN